MPVILVTGSEGLIGAELCRQLKVKGMTPRRFDLRHAENGRIGGDVCSADALRGHMEGVRGIVHLAAVSRVLAGEKDPRKCWETNVGGTHNVLAAAAEDPGRPWVVMASSREVYGDVASLPVREDCPPRPVNVYGRSKLEGERETLAARGLGLRTAVIRFSNVFGDTGDHPDRVVPAFARAAAAGVPMRVDGVDHTFDFSHVRDVAAGLVQVIEAMEAGAADLPPIHFATGRATTLLELARLANRFGGGQSRITEAPPRSFDVSHFVGDPSRARTLLGWTPSTGLEDGLKQLVAEFKDLLRTPMALSA